MSVDQRCPGLIDWNNSFDNTSDIVPLRVAVVKGCYLTLVYYFNIIMKALKRPFVLTYCNDYLGWKDSIWMELWTNKSDFSPNIAEVNYVWYDTLQYSPTFFFGNAITILSGRIFNTTGSGLSILSTFTLQLWLLFYAILILIAICNSIKHQDNSKWTFNIVDIVRQFVKLWAVTINQSNQFGNICCVKHLILNSVTIISIFVLILFFNSEILSKILFHPLVKIDTLDDLVDFVKLHQDVKLISDNLTSTWSIMQDWEDERAQFIFDKMISVPFYEFDYKQVYNGESIIISFDYSFEQMLRSNRGLSFHMSADRLFHRSHALLYSKYIERKTKRFIDSIMTSLFESGIYNFKEEKKISKHQEIKEEEKYKSISLSYFRRTIFPFTRVIIILLSSLIFEILLSLFKTKKREIKKLLEFLQTVPEKLMRLCKWHKIQFFLYKIKRTDIKRLLLSLQTVPEKVIRLCRWRPLYALLIHSLTALSKIFQKTKRRQTVNFRLQMRRR